MQGFSSLHGSFNQKITLLAPLEVPDCIQSKQSHVRHFSFAPSSIAVSKNSSPFCTTFASTIMPMNSFPRAKPFEPFVFSPSIEMVDIQHTRDGHPQCTDNHIIAIASTGCEWIHLVLLIIKAHNTHSSVRSFVRFLSLSLPSTHIHRQL